MAFFVPVLKSSAFFVSRTGSSAMTALAGGVTRTFAAAAAGVLAMPRALSRRLSNHHEEKCKEFDIESNNSLFIEEADAAQGVVKSFKEALPAIRTATQFKGWSLALDTSKDINKTHDQVKAAACAPASDSDSHGRLSTQYSSWSVTVSDMWQSCCNVLFTGSLTGCQEFVEQPHKAAVGLAVLLEAAPGSSDLLDGIRRISRPSSPGSLPDKREVMSYPLFDLEEEEEEEVVAEEL